MGKKSASENNSRRMVQRTNGKNGIKPKGLKSLTVERLRQLIPQVTNKNRRRDFATRLRTLVKQERTKKRRGHQAARARGEEVAKGITHTIESLRRPDETSGERKG